MRRLGGRVTVLVRAALRDLFADAEAEAAQHTSSLDDPLAETLAGIQARLDALQLEQASALAGARQAAQARQAAEAETNARLARVDEALRAGDEAAARTALQRAQPWQAQAAALAEDEQAARQQVEQLSADLETLRRKLANLRHEWQRLSAQERVVQAREAAGQARRALVEEAGALETQLAERAQHLARRADRQSARDELSRERQE
jgi:phage shock protein A